LRIAEFKLYSAIRNPQSAMVTGFNHIQIAAPLNSETAARRFYGELLGLPEIPKPPELAKRGGVWFSCGDQQLHVGIESDFHPARKAHPAFSVVELDVLRERIEGAGFATESDDKLPGYRRFYTFDPFGNRLEFLEPLEVTEDT
jgi:catechol 2,3-dioxygenase-like lactoylglutathione lyase family enzyme